METILNDLRYAFRLMIKRPTFTAAAVLSLALGIGANSTIFTIAKAAFLQTVPVADPSHLVMIYSTQNNRHGPEFQFLDVSYLNARDIREKKNDVFSGVAIGIPAGTTLTISGREERASAELVNWDFLKILGVQPALGRSFLPDEDSSPGSGAVAILSYALWNKQFGANKEIIGHTINLNLQDFTVVGVAPREFHDAGALGNPDLWVPISMHEQLLSGLDKDWYNDRGARLTRVVGRLKPGVSLQTAEDAIHAFAAELARDFPKDNRGRSVQLVPINQTIIPPDARGVAEQATTIMMAIVALVLLIACANVANLLLSRATLRQREIAIRLSLGARRARLLQQLLSESLLLGITAGALAMLLALGGRGLILRLIPNGVARTLDFSLDTRVLLFTLALSLAATLLFGLGPALQSSRASQLDALRDRTALSAGGSTRWYGLRGILVMLQVALSLIALVGAGLFIHSLRNAQEIDPGFEVKHEVTAFINLSAQHYPQAKTEQFFKDAIERLKTLPTVADASFADIAPLEGGLQRTTFPDGVDSSDPSNGALTPVIAVSPGYFRASGISLLEGRDFTESDDAQGAMVSVVNRALAERVWPGQDPIGKHLHFLGETWDVSVIGVAATVKYATLGEPPQPIVYFPMKQHFSPAATLYVRTKEDPRAAIAGIRSALQSLDPGLPLRRIFTGSDLLDRSLAAPRVGAELLGAFGALALVLAGIGTYGVMSYSVTQRTQEIGIRMALGAAKREVLRLVLLSGMAMVMAGIALGLAGSALLTRAMHSLLYGIGVFDGASFVVTALLLMVVALVACGIPAIRASMVDPSVALRYE